MASVKIKDKIILEADVVYLLMKKGFPISRNVRAQWMLEHLDTVITTQSKNVKNKEAEELEIVSVSPKSRPESWSEEMSDRFAYKVTSKTTIIFLAHKYRMVFNLDLSPSLATVDIQHGEIVIDEVYTATKNFLENIIKPFTLPGCKRVFQPEIYVTIIAHTPFFTSPAQQVLVQGWLATKDNIDQLTVYVKQQLHLLEGKVALVTSVVNQQIESLRAENERLVGGLFEENVCTNKVSTTPITSPESSFVNILRYGMLALSLLPEYSCAHMIIVTDGILGNPDGPVLDFLMQQLRATTIACSFLHVGSTYHPHCGDGLVPYQDLLHFVARATLGVCMSYIPYPINQTGTEMNVYQRNFLCWLLYREPDNSNHNYDNNSNINWTLRNTLFYEQKSTQLLQKKQIEDKVTCTLSSLLCCRLREGYLIKYANIKDEMLEISFVLLWKSSVLLEYDISCPWTTKSLSASSCIQYTISIEAPYEFLHDITCLSKKPLKSHYRQGVVNRFWATLTSLTESDNMLAHFSWFPEFGWTWYSVPDTIRSGMPVFYLSAYPSPSTVQLSDAACPQFAQIYQPVVSLSSTHWSRYMHTQRLTLLLAHDRPLPRHLQLTNQSGRFQSIQSRQSFAVLSAMLKNWSTFVLVENHTYVQFIYREIDKPPVSFSLIRINSKNLVVVLNIAFAAGTEGAVRHNVVGDLLERLAKLTLPNRNTEKETPSCVIIKKSLEKILIRYERMPKDFTVVNFPDEYNKLNSGGITASLSRYLYHNRWLWHVKRPFVQSIPGVVLPRLNITAIARILSTITKMRLAEGFNFTYSASGILNMVLEVQMCGVKQNDECYPCIIQYVLFPPYVTSNTISERDSTSEEDTDEGTEVSMDDAENFGDFQIISEIWIEPQHGFTKLYSQGTAGYMNRLQYHEIPEAISRLDEDCVNALLTLEYLCLLSQLAPNEKSTEIVYGQTPHYNKYKKSNKNVRNSNSNNCNIEDSCGGIGNVEERINIRNFVFDALNILPKCQQAELLYSMFNDGNNDENLGSANKILMDNYLECIKQLHNKELLLTSAESQRFTKLLLERRKAGGLPLKENYWDLDHASECPRWKCFIKGITASHVIITILPASDKDARLFINKPSSNKELHPNCEEDDSVNSNEEHSKNVEKYSKDEEHLISKTDGEEYSINKNEKYSNSDEYSTVNNENSEMLNTNSSSIGELNKIDRNDNDCEEPKLFDLCNNSQIINESSRMIKVNNDSKSSTIDSSDDSKCSKRDSKTNEDSLMIPVYVYDCSLSFLIDTFVDKLKATRNKDIYQDNRFRIEGKDHGDIVELRECGGAGSKPVTPEPRSEDSDNTSNEQKSLMEHLKQLSLSHCHCFVVAVYTSLVLNEPLTYNDMESAIEQCEESLIEINITSYLRSVCKHLNKLEDEDRLSKSGTKDCDGVKQLHELVKEKFERIIGVAFRPVPAHPEFYYCAPSKTENDTELGEMQKSDSDDDLENLIFDGNINRKGNSSWPPLNTDFQTKTSQPLFLQLSCSIRLKHRSLLTTVPVKNLPTCFFEILEKLENQEAEKDDILNSKLSDLKITLDIISLNLPKEVSEKYLEDNIKNDIFEKEGKMNYLKKMNYLNSGQNNVINNLKEDIEWILKDETATAFLDKNIVDDEILKFVINHVFESADKFSCKFEKVPLNFVFSSEESKPKFINELKKLEICEYWLREKGNFYYLEKVRNNRERPELKGDLADSMPKQERGQDENSRHLRKIDFDDFKNECSWLVELEKRENSLPNFWLILSVENDFVNVYFHCRFLEIDSPEVLTYNQTQNTLITQIKSICRRVNQYLLLQNLHKTSKCSELLESEDYNSMEDFNWRTEARKETLSVLKSKEGTQNFTPGMFQCRVVWKFTFRLHPRLKTGPGRPGLSRGIKALHGVLNRFAVTNRSNMFVYQENNKNVFYLRLHEQISNNKSLQSNLSDDSEQLLVSRSNSVVSLSQTTLGNNNSSDTRPRVRSFSEKQSNVLNKDSEDSIVLMVHGISEAGPEVKHDLVQVLQNRLDDAVLEVLSVMLARNPMCKLTPADVCFVQPPTQPESIIELTIGEHCLPYISALEFYLKQNILQFLYIPKYTDRIECRFRDHSELDNENIFLYNQSHSSGNKGIAVIALSAVSNRVTDCGSTTADQSAENSALKMNDSVMDLNSSVPGDTIYKQSSCFLDMDLEDFEKIVSTSISEKSVKNSDSSIKFKIWKQGKVNLESLSGKLILAVKHSVWDLVTEYKFLAAPFSEKINHHVEEDKIKGSKESTDESEEKVVVNEKGIKNEQSSVREKKKLMRNEERSAKHEKKFLKTSGSKKGEEKHGKDEENCNRKEEEQSTKNKDIKNEEKQNASKAESMEAEGGEKLSDIYCSTLPKWFRFALDIGVPSVKKHEVIIDPRHAIGTIIIELENIIQSQSSNTSFKAFVLKSRQPFVEKFELDEQAMVSKSTERKKESKKKAEVPTYIPWDYKKDMQGVFTKCILIARNFEQRKPSFSNTNETESLVPKDQKLLQKFNPLILDSNFVKEGFLSRQGILIAEVQSDKVTLYMYHWSKEKSEKIIKQTTSLGSWLSSRSSFFTNVTMQKLGIFSHRPNHKNSSHVIEIEGLMKFEKIGKDWNKGSSKGQSMNMKYSWNEVMRDVKCSDNSYHNSHYGNVDPIAKAVNELQELRNKEKKVKDDLSKLCAMWPDRNVVPNIPISTAALTAFKQYSRIIHFCHTPLLFLPSWRLQSAATRDHSLTTAAEQSTLNNCHQEKHKGQDEPNEKWHRELCESMLKEYREYLHFLGFCSVDVEMKNSEGQAQQQSYYLKKLMLGGVLLFEIQLSEPFFIVKLNIIECSRLQTKTTSASVNQFMLSFVDACDKIKINMHLHSFTYDFHLRCIHSYIARSGSMEQGYHLINFLDDFNKYYSKAPNYARNLIYSDTITIPNLPISGRTLYSYLLTHYNLYNMVALEMRQPSHDPEATEHVLVNLNRLPLIDSLDSQESRPESNDFEVVLIVSLLSQIEKMEIGLKYYLILTSKREVYPKRDMENYSTLGKFQTVHNVEKSKSSSKEITAENPSCQEPKPNLNDNKSQTVNCGNSTAPVPPPVPNSLFSRNLNVSKSSETSSIQIRQESINYLGYYSSHEQSMQRTIALKANEARSSIIQMINKGALQCRTHLLWNKLLDSKSTMNYGEFMELCELAKVEPLSNIDARLKTFLNQPIAWYQALMKVLQNKYQENHKIFNTPDGNVTHLLVLHPSYYQVFMMLTIDLHATRGDLYAVYRKSEELINTPYCVEDTYNLIEGFVNACCFHLWMNLCS